MSVDKVVDVRYSAIKALSGCYSNSKFDSENAEVQMEIVFDDSSRIFASSKDWKLRQLYIYLCEFINQLHKDTPNQYALRFLPKLFLLKEDHGLNVRLSVGTLISQHLHENEFYSNLSSDCKSEIDECLQRLLVDGDRNVQLSVGGVYESTGKSI